MQLTLNNKAIMDKVIPFKNILQFLQKLDKLDCQNRVTINKNLCVRLSLQTMLLLKNIGHNRNQEEKL